jgi:hypothetical protein
MLPVDHIIYATPDLPSTVQSLGERLGVEPAEGGRHPGWGTRNYLLSLGSRVYLEVLGPDLETAPPEEGRLFALDRLPEPRLLTWAARATGLAGVREQALGGGPVDIGDVVAGRRALPTGGTLEWELTDPALPRCGGLVPFFIDWLESPHPSATAPSGCRLLSLEGFHPDPESVRATLKSVPVPGLSSMTLHAGPAAALRATLQTPRGEVVLS